MDMELKEYTMEDTEIGSITIVYNDKDEVLIENIVLSNPDFDSKELAYKMFENLESVDYDELNAFVKDLVLKLKSYLNGEEVEFSLEHFDLDQLTDFERAVLTTEFNTEKGSVNTYKELANAAGHPKAQRAVGNTLRKNPFPIVIPCHRTIKSDRKLGGFNGYQGGLDTKEILLTLEGVEIQHKKVVSESPIISLNRREQTKLVENE